MIAQPAAADRVTSALVDVMGRMVRGLGGETFMRQTGDAVLVVTGLVFPMMNGVLTIRTSVLTEAVDALLDDPALQHITHSVQLRPGCSPEVAALAARRAMHEEESLPLMAMAAPASALEDAQRVDGLTIRALEAADAGIHANIAAAGFEVPVAFFDAFATPSVLGQPGFHTYVGTVDGTRVTTAIGVQGDDYIGIFDVATPPEHRGRGYGAAVTAKAVLDGFETGATFAFLQSSQMGYGVYQRLGFETIETWSLWVSGSPSRS